MKKDCLKNNREKSFFSTRIHNHCCVSLFASTKNQKLYYTINIIIHPSIINLLSVVRSQRQQFQQGAPVFPFSGHIIQLWLENFEAFPGLYRDIISPLGPGSAPGPPPTWTSLEHLQKEAPGGIITRYPNHLTWLLSSTKEKWLHSEFLTENWTSHLIPQGDASHPPQESHFSHLHPQSHPFGHDPSFMTTGEGGNKDWAPFGSALFLSQRCSKVNTKPLPLHQFSSQSPAP